MPDRSSSIDLPMTKTSVDIRCERLESHIDKLLYWKDSNETARRQPIGQGSEGLPSRSTDSAPHPDAVVPVIMALTQTSSVADDCVLAANRTSPRQEFQRDHPYRHCSSASGSAIKRITAGVKAAADRRCQVSIWGPAFTLR